MSNPTDWQFGFTQVIEIVMVAVSAAGTYWALKRNNEKNREKIENVEQRSREKIKALEETIDAMEKAANEKFIHARNSKKANVQMLEDKIRRVEDMVEKKETKIYMTLDDVRKEQKEAHGQIAGKMDTVLTQLGSLATTIGRMEGYFQAKNEKDKG